ncbi:pentapeptide repeat-containing protein [Megasphaera sp. UPII 135-E]|uniref:pentapeptide repeat-containing protein n=1 Tax=Megasphaera sp. UPII 135-E TaxID=1000569 RepID=UPI00021A2207|nr:pentapeptide repeat-containing protein [Megasphaera sp. UPII 135-E]EGS36244.1 pentapeptide repeat protein [Megasphaera sp. UPII 135-E]DAK43010.1 MAG TPA: pentapeptide repeat protein [Caudoviricetes sp.]
MRTITQEEIDEKAKAHKLWWDTNGGQGKRAVFRNVLITNKDFSHQNLRGALFEDIRCTYTNFERTNLSSARFKNVSFHQVKFRDANLTSTTFLLCDITDTSYFYANLKTAAFTGTILIDVDFRSSNLHCTNFSAAKIKNIFVTNAIQISVIGQRVICTQVNTSRRNNLISYWADLGIWTTGCFQGTLEELRERVAQKHENNPFLRDRYERAINYILAEDKADKEKERKNDR